MRMFCNLRSRANDSNIEMEIFSWNERHINLSDGCARFEKHCAGTANEHDEKVSREIDLSRDIYFHVKSACAFALAVPETPFTGMQR